MTGPLEAVQEVAAPETFHVSPPAGAANDAEPDTRAVNVRGCPTVGLEGVLLTKIVAVDWPRFIVRIEDVADA